MKYPLVRSVLQSFPKMMCKKYDFYFYFFKTIIAWVAGASGDFLLITFKIGT